jgi:hypothetical protein
LNPKAKNRPSLVYCGDDQSAKNVAAKLIHDAGLIRWMLADSGSLVGELAYGADRGPELAYRFERFWEIEDQIRKTSSEGIQDTMEIKRIGTQPSVNGPPGSLVRYGSIHYFRHPIRHLFRAPA